MKTGIETQGRVPGGVYLCQVSATVSCGACCGLYNVDRPDRISLHRLLARRTDIFRTTPRTPEALDDYVRGLTATEPQKRPFADFHHCPYLGLIGAEHQRVGCLLHPMGNGNQGVDYRGLSHYGGMACRIYFCATVHCMQKRYKQIVGLVADDWYVHGLLVTETELITALLKHIETRSGASLDPRRATGDPRTRNALAKLLAIKLDWPFRPVSHATACHYPFKDNRYPKPVIDYAGLGTTPSGLDSILFQLGSTFAQVSQLRQAEASIQRRVEDVLQALAADDRNP